MNDINKIDLLSLLSSIDQSWRKTKLNNLISNANAIIASEVAASVSDIIQFDIGIGTLMIYKDTDCLSYKFIPSDTLETSIKRNITNNRDLFVSSLETRLRDQISALYCKED